MKSDVIEVFTDIQLPAGTIYAYLAQPHNFVGLQPLVIRVENVRSSTIGDRTQCYDYEAVERLRLLGVIPYDNRIRSRMILTEPDSVLKQTVQAAFGIEVQQTLTLTPRSHGSTRVTNTVAFHAPDWIFGYVRQQIQAAHSQLVINLKQRLEQNR